MAMDFGQSRRRGHSSASRDQTSSVSIVVAWPPALSMSFTGHDGPVRGLDVAGALKALSELPLGGGEAEGCGEGGDVGLGSFSPGVPHPGRRQEAGPGASGDITAPIRLRILTHDPMILLPLAMFYTEQERPLFPPMK